MSSWRDELGGLGHVGKKVRQEGSGQSEECTRCLKKRGSRKADIQLWPGSGGERAPFASVWISSPTPSLLPRDWGLA